MQKTTAQAQVRAEEQATKQKKTPKQRGKELYVSESGLVGSRDRHVADKVKEGVVLERGEVAGGLVVRREDTAGGGGRN